VGDERKGNRQETFLEMPKEVVLPCVTVERPLRSDPRTQRHPYRAQGGHVPCVSGRGAGVGGCSEMRPEQVNETSRGCKREEVQKGVQSRANSRGDPGRKESDHIVAASKGRRPLSVVGSKKLEFEKGEGYRPEGGAVYIPSRRHHFQREIVLFNPDRRASHITDKEGKNQGSDQGKEGESCVFGKQ